MSLLGTKCDLRVSGVPQAVVIEWSKNNSDIHQDHFVLKFSLHVTNVRKVKLKYFIVLTLSTGMRWLVGEELCVCIYVLR